jgi:hypothetical protein
VLDSLAASVKDGGMFWADLIDWIWDFVVARSIFRRIIRRRRQRELRTKLVSNDPTARPRDDGSRRLR